MPEYLAPGVFVEETSFRAKSIEGVGTSTAAFVGLTARGPTAGAKTDPMPTLLTSYTDFERIYGGTDDLLIGGKPTTNYLAHAVNAFFASLIGSWAGLPVLTPVQSLLVGAMLGVPATWAFARHIRRLMDQADAAP